LPAVFSAVTLPGKIEPYSRCWPNYRKLGK